MRNKASLHETGRKKALQILRNATTPTGILASVTDIDNYQRVFARDAVICGLAGLVCGDEIIIDGLRHTLETLAECQGPDGQIPSNVQKGEQGDIIHLSYGGLAGRVDTIPWFIIGVCNYVKFTGDDVFGEEMLPAVRKGLELLNAWEFNSKGLIYVPLSGDWADEYIYHGYIFHDQILRLWAMRCHDVVFIDQKASGDSEMLANMLRVNYWPTTRGLKSEYIYHPYAALLYLQERGEPRYWLPVLTPGGYHCQFDGFSNALAVLIGLSNDGQIDQILDHGELIIEQTGSGLVPIFWPPILEGEPLWHELLANFKYRFKNIPYHSHNGGIWPMVSGWWGLAQIAGNRIDDAKKMLEAIHVFNRKGEKGTSKWAFYEHGHGKTGEPLGTPRCSWSAAAALLLEQGLAGKQLLGLEYRNPSQEQMSQSVEIVD